MRLNKKNRLLLAAISLMIAAGISFANEQEVTVHPELMAYPAAIEGMVRFVIALPEKSRAESELYKVEIIPGKVLATDGVNKSFVDYQVDAGVIQGWGYTYYTIEGQGQQATTRIGVVNNQSTVTEFVAGKSVLVDYNSRLPLVVYGPSDSNVRFKIWNAAEKSGRIPRG